jgi:hypothetical protein
VVLKQEAHVLCRTLGHVAPGGLVAVALAVALATVPAHAQDKQSVVTFSGIGGQTASINVGETATDIVFPWFGHPRLAGPDGTVSGVLIQRGPDVVGGAVLLNAPGFDDAIMLPLGPSDGIHLQPGRYRVTMLGWTRQKLMAVTRSGAARTISMTGPARPITRSFSSSGAPLDMWSHRLGRIKAGNTLVLGLGAGGTLDAHAAQSCLQRGDVAPSGPCVQGASKWLGGPDGASWGGSVQTVTSDEGPFVYSGQIETGGVNVTAGHVAVVISPRP